MNMNSNKNEWQDEWYSWFSGYKKQDETEERNSKQWM